MFTMFTSTKKEKIMKGQKRYFLLPYEKKGRTVSLENGNINSKVNLKNCRKTSVDMSIFG